MDRSARKSGHRDQRAGTSSSSSHLERAAVKTEVTVKTESKEVSTICRVCLQCGDIPIHGNDSFTDVSQELNAIAGINVRQDDEYPKHLCASCNSQLQGAIQLRTTAQYSEVILLQQNESRVEDAEDWNTLEETDSPTGSSLHEDLQADETVKNKTNNFQNIKNIFNLKVLRNQDMSTLSTSGQKPDACFLKMEPLTVGNKSVAQQNKLSLDLRNKSVSSQNSSNVDISSSAPLIVKDKLIITSVPPKILKNKLITINKRDLIRKPNMDKTKNETNSKKMNFNRLSTKQNPGAIKRDLIRKLSMDKNKTDSKITKSNPLSTEQNPCASKINILPELSLLDLKLKKQIEALRNLGKVEKSEIPAPPKRVRREVRRKEVNPEDKLFCRRCKIKFENTEEQHKHNKTYGHKNFKVACGICHKLFTFTSLKTHQVVHTREISHVCDICGKGFSLKSGLDNHIPIHSSVFPFQCDLCPYRCRSKNTLRVHIRTHTGEKRHQCSVCAARFLTTSNLKSHILKKHTDEYSYKCNLCGRGFHFNRDMEKHIKVNHLGIKEHVCNICGKAFGVRKQMTKHEIKVHKRKPGSTGRIPSYILAQQQGSGTEVDDAFDK